MSHQPLDKNTREALETIGDTAFEIRQRAFETISGKMNVQDFLNAATVHVAFLTQVLPVLRARLANDIAGEAEDQEADPRAPIAQLCATYILVPIVRTNVTDHGFAVKQQGELS